MQVNSTLNTNYALQDTSSTNAKKEVKSDGLSDIATLKIANESKQAQIDAYVAGSKQANDENSSNEQTQQNTQNYTDFAKDIRQANNYQTLVENGVTLSDLQGRPSIQPIPEPLDQEQKDTLRQGIVSVAGYESTQDQIEAYAAGTQQSNNSFNETVQYVEDYNQFAQDVRRSDSLNTYIEYNNYLVG